MTTWTEETLDSAVIEAKELLINSTHNLEIGGGFILQIQSDVAGSLTSWTDEATPSSTWTELNQS